MMTKKLMKAVCAVAIVTGLTTVAPTTGMAQSDDVRAKLTIRTECRRDIEEFTSSGGSYAARTGPNSCLNWKFSFANAENIRVDGVRITPVGTILANYYTGSQPPMQVEFERVRNPEKRNLWRSLSLGCAACGCKSHIIEVGGDRRC